MTAALMLTAGIYSFADRTFLADALAGSIRTGRLELSVLGFEFSVPTANGIDMRAMLLYFAAAVVLPSLMAMIFRNLYLIIKRSERAARFFRRIISVCSARSAFSPSPFRSRGLR